MYMLLNFALSLLLTLFLEGILALLWRIRGKDLLLFALANVLTNPLAVLLHTMFPQPVVTATIEIGAVAAEGFCYDRLGNRIRKPWLFALAANCFSFGVGVWINHVWL